MIAPGLENQGMFTFLLLTYFLHFPHFLTYFYVIVIESVKTKDCALLVIKFSICYILVFVDVEVSASLCDCCRHRLHAVKSLLKAMLSYSAAHTL